MLCYVNTHKEFNFFLTNREESVSGLLRNLLNAKRVVQVEGAKKDQVENVGKDQVESAILL